MKTQAFAAIVATIALGAASASAQNTTAGANAQASPAQMQPAPTHRQEAAQTPPANVSTATSPAAAQQDTNPTATDTSASNAQVEPPSGKNAEIGTATINPTGIPPSQRNPLLADNGDVRISKLIGSTIYNKDDQKVGSVDDVLAGQNGQLEVVVSTNNKKTVVPWDRLVFGDAKLNSDNTVLMPNATRAQLDKMQAFNYTDNNKK
jgi:PRC-barrel domain